jgi:hypothetical protein
MVTVEVKESGVASISLSKSAAVLLAVDSVVVVMLLLLLSVVSVVELLSLASSLEAWGIGMQSCGFENTFFEVFSTRTIGMQPFHFNKNASHIKRHLFRKTVRCNPVLGI